MSDRTNHSRAASQGERAKAYGEDLAFIHDAGFLAHAQHAAPTFLALAREHKPPPGLVVELGCGSGEFAARVCEAGYDVLGYDISAAMLELARRRAPRAEFRQASFLDVEFPPCAAVCSTGEIFNYLFDARNGAARLKKLFKQVHQALEPGGLFFFDFATPGRVAGGRTSAFRQGDDWACLFSAEEDARRGTLTRDITTFRRVGELFRRDHETHRLKLFKKSELSQWLRDLGFRARSLASYGEYQFPPGYASFAARKA